MANNGPGKLINAMQSTAAFVCAAVPFRLMALAVEEHPEKPDSLRVVFAFYTAAPEWSTNGKPVELRWISDLDDLTGMKSSDVAKLIVTNLRKEVNAAKAEHASRMRGRTSDPSMN